MAILTASVGTISTDVTYNSYQYGHRWQRGPNYASKRGCRKAVRAQASLKFFFISDYVKVSALKTK